MKLLQPGNSKLGSHMMMFNLPATKTICQRICAGCYAAREQVRFPSVLEARESRYQASLQTDFATKVISELSSKRKLPKYVRVHASGEFYSQEYLDSWTTIAKAHPNIVFYAYTKRLKDFDFSALQSLPNFVLINSLHYGSLNYGITPPPNALVCPATTKATKATTRCGETCTLCMTKGQADVNGIFFYRH